MSKKRKRRSRSTTRKTKSGSRGTSSWAIPIIVAAVVLDQIYDNLVSPRIFGQTLGVHPAAVLIAAIIAANLIGFVGLLLAAPVLASLQLFGRYAMRKMVDLDPWPEPEAPPEEVGFPFEETLRRLFGRLKGLLSKRKKK